MQQGTITPWHRNVAFELAIGKV